MHSFKLLFLIFVFLLANKSIIKAQNIFIDGSFEENSFYWWKVTNDPANATIAFDNTTSHTGNFSAKLTCNAYSDTVFSVIAQQVPVVAGRSYYLEYWAKANNIDKYIYPFVQFKSSTADNSAIWETYILPMGDQPDWFKVTARFTAPPQSNYFVLGLYLISAGVCWFDDITLIELQDTSHHSFAVNLNQSIGSFKHLTSSNLDAGSISSPYNVVSESHNAGIDMVRTHDYHTAFDMHVVFPDTSRNPLDPTAYDFHTTDSIVATILNSNFNIYYRLGESFEMTPIYNHPPADMEKWSQVALQIVKHYNDGWNNGFHLNIKYWEIWNEPDIPQFWSGTAAQYAHLYSLTASKIKAFDPSSKVGGPTLANFCNSSFVKTFLDTIMQNNIPLDFFVYHVYQIMNPYNYRVFNQFAEEKLATYGLNNTEIYISEWNPYIVSFSVPSLWGNDSTALNAATTISAINYLQDSEIDKMFRYDTRSWYFGMFSVDRTPKASAMALYALNSLMSNADRISTVGSDSCGTTIIAGQKNDNSVEVIIANNSSVENGYQLQFNNMLASDLYQYTIYRIDSANHYESVKTGTITAQQNTIICDVKAPFVDHIKLDLLVGVDQISLSPEIKIYPNPSNGIITIEQELTTIEKIKIYSATGQLVTEIINPLENKITVTNLQSGIYLVKITTNNIETISRKIVVL